MSTQPDTWHTVDREELLRRVDLAALLDRLAPPAERRRLRRWRCIDPVHEDRDPSVSMRVVGGIGRWRCWSCGQQGTAIDALVVARGLTVGEAIRQLATFAHVEPIQHEPSPAEPVPLHRSVERYVDACHCILRSSTGRAVREWLIEERGLGPEVLDANRVGADPGPELLPRRRGLPRSGLAGVLPAFDRSGALSYVQARYLDPSASRKYGNPVGRLGTNPGLSWTRTPAVHHSDYLVVCEGVIDALTVASAGVASVAVLGATYPSIRIARAIASHAGDRQILIGFDGDDTGRIAAARLGELLASRGHDSRVVDLPDGTDLNSLARTTPGWVDQLLGPVGVHA